MSSVSDIVKTIGSELRKAQNHMFSRRYAECDEILGRLFPLLAEGLAQQADNPQLKTLENQLAKLKKDLTQKTGSGQATASSSTTFATAVKPQQDGARLPAGVEKRLRDMAQLIGRGGKQSDQDAISVFHEIAAQYAGQFDVDHPDYRKMALWVEKTQADTAAAIQNDARDKARQEMERNERERLSNEWEAQLKELGYFSYGTSDIDTLLNQETRFSEINAVFSRYKNVAFPYGKTVGLEQKENDIADRISSFPGRMAEAKKAVFSEMQEHLESRLKELDKEIEGKPAIMSDTSIRQAEAFVGDRRRLFTPESEESRRIDSLFQELTAKNAHNKLARAKLVFIQDDRYRGDDAQEIKACMEKMVRAAAVDASLYKTVIHSADWKEISQWEDYAGTQRFVTRAEIYGQCAIRQNGQGRLFTVYVTRERRSDGGWSELQGNVMYSDDLAVENM